MSPKTTILTAVSVLALAAAATSASASPTSASVGLSLKPRAGEIMRPTAREAPYKAPPAVGGTWTHLDHAFPGQPDTPVQLTDGSVMVHDYCAQGWYRLVPDINGDYVHGTWVKTALMPKGYAPLYFASQVLADGRLVVNGGEYINNGECNAVWSNKGAIYDPVANKWRAVAAPKGWSQMGDAQSSVLPDGRYFLANPLTIQQVTGTFDAAGVPTWTITGVGKKDRNDEEGWTQTPFNTILTVDATRNRTSPNSKTEIYDIATGIWTDGEDTPNQLVDPEGSEVGPAVLIPNGKIFQVGGKPCGKEETCPGHTAIYDTLTGHWAAGPDIPKVGKDLGDSSDGPAALLPNGNVLIQTGPKFAAPSHFFEWNGTKLTRVSEPDQAPDMSSFEGRMMILPTGQILWTSDQGDIEVYTTTYKTNPDWAPVIAKAPKKVVRGQAGYNISGIRFNGLTEGSGYGDDAQSYTNYPLVRITNKETGHVCYTRTHDHSVMGINGPEDPTSTKFDVPSTCEAGASSIEVVANGMASPKVNTTVN